VVGVRGDWNKVREIVFHALFVIVEEFLKLFDCGRRGIDEERVGKLAAIPTRLQTTKVNAADPAPEFGDRVWNRSTFLLNALNMSLYVRLNAG
jgi:hypothetical protein